MHYNFFKFILYSVFIYSVCRMCVYDSIHMHNYNIRNCQLRKINYLSFITHMSVLYLPFCYLCRVQDVIFYSFYFLSNTTHLIYLLCVNYKKECATTIYVLLPLTPVGPVTVTCVPKDN